MITYCTNIHPGESWEEVFLNLQTHVTAVKEAVCPDLPFPIGLRLSNRATLSLNEKAARDFHSWCEEYCCFVPTLNGFPYGSFHHDVIKYQVYLPDWRSKERCDYTKRLACLLDRWLPDNTIGSISTVPIGFRGHVDKGDYGLIRQNLIDVLEYMDALRQKSGKEIILSLEPEPGCILETTQDVILFFEKMHFPDAIKDAVGICFDCCHQAIVFEEPAEALSRLDAAAIRIGKFQVSSALRLIEPDPDVLERFCESTYLHQVAVRKQNGRLARYDDIPEALLTHHSSENEEWRIHFHVPIFLDSAVNCGTTQGFIKEALPLMQKGTLQEIETYTWNILPMELKLDSITASLIREIEWLKAQSNEANRCS